LIETKKLIKLLTENGFYSYKKSRQGRPVRFADEDDIFISVPNRDKIKKGKYQKILTKVRLNRGILAGEITDESN